MSDFVVKLHDLSIDYGVFVTTSSFTEDATNLAKYYNVETMDARISNEMFKKNGIDYYSRIHHLGIKVDGPAVDAARTVVDIADKLGILKAVFGN